MGNRVQTHMLENATSQKFMSDRPFAKPEAAARELLKIYRKLIDESPYGPFCQVGVTNSEFIYRRGGSVAEYGAGRDYGIAQGWIEIYAGGCRVRILPAGEDALGTI